MKAKGLAVNFVLTNKSKYAFRDVVIADTVPKGVGFRGAHPRPSLKKSMPDGSVRLEWRVDYMLPKEKKTFRYRIDKRKLFMPKAKIIRYERVGELEEIPAAVKKRAARPARPRPPKPKESIQRMVERVLGVRVTVTRVKKRKSGR
ncbi:MAG: hypothetical protein QXD77_03545 [Candidatus Aenigmatarchaeota archaeon]